MEVFNSFHHVANLLVYGKERYLRRCWALRGDKIQVNGGWGIVWNRGGGACGVLEGLGKGAGGGASSSGNRSIDVSLGGGVDE